MKQTSLHPNFGQQEHDDASIHRWVEACLRMKNDEAINQAMSGMFKVDAKRIKEAITSQFSDFTEKVGPRQMRVRLISIPVAVKADAPMDENSFLIQDVAPYLQSFYRHGLITPSNGGVVLINKLLDHSILEGTSLSDLYLLSRAIFDCARKGKSGSPHIGKFGEAVDESSWLSGPDGCHTMRHLLGVVFWDESKPEPPMLKNQGDIDAWQRSTLNTILMNLMTPENVGLEVSVMQPGCLFDSILLSTIVMIRRIVGIMAAETCIEVRNPVARISVGCDPGEPGRNHIRVEISPADNKESIFASATMQLSIMESTEITAVLSCITDRFREQGIHCQEPEYFLGSKESGAPSPVH